MKKMIFLISGAFLIVLLTGIKAQEVSRGELINSIRNGADYACKVLLDENGRSKCDYNWIEGRWYLYEPAWHTGQLIWGLLRAYEVTGDDQYLESAEKAGDWWAALQIRDDSNLKGMLGAYHGDEVGDIIVFATISDGSPGLFQLTRITGKKKYAEVATDAGRWMLSKMYIPEEGVFYDCVNPETGKVLSVNSPFWKEKKVQTLYDVARPNNEGFLFKDMYEFTGEKRYKEVFLNLCESLLEKQGKEGLWMDFTPNNKKEGYFHPRFNLWYAESLLEGYEMTGDRRYLAAAKKTAKFYTRFQQKDGTIYYRNYLDGRINRDSPCGSAVAFAGIIWLRLLRYGEGEEFRKNIEKSVRWVLRNQFQPDHPDPNLAGGFFELRTRHKKGKLWLTVRDIATSFSLRFLADYYEYRLK